ncbi:hypothetical protein [Pseudomarimonas salicorniae]|uniref:Lycopene cyclase domain-containing protein n=1 Tax=Pseudomarimonas salicorniae TaxID=2933270 RepID=A0ABT0GM70_9GAMM|nr:hypothetical protein [Lysobacter sp. CAU 1642]MCK7595644.1 hypothetical protein [Lysobacter sp. CAU 1642]
MVQAVVESGSAALSAWPLFLLVVFSLGLSGGILGQSRPKLAALLAIAASGLFLATADYGWFDLFIRAESPLEAIGFYLRHPKLGFDTVLLPVLACILVLLVSRTLWHAFHCQGDRA